MAKSTSKDATVTFDAEALTFDDLEAFEDATGKDLLEVLDSGAAGAGAKVLKALYWIGRRQSEPDFTLEAAGAVPILELKALFVADEEEEGESPSV